jgi:hypothetical protein
MRSGRPERSRPEREQLRRSSGSYARAAEGSLKRAAKRPVRLRAEHRGQSELGRLRDAAVCVSDGTQLARQADLAKARERSTVDAAERGALSGAGNRQRDGEI